MSSIVLSCHNITNNALFPGGGQQDDTALTYMYMTSIVLAIPLFVQGALVVINLIRSA